MPPDFFTRHDVVQIAKDLLGCYLITEMEGIRTIGRISETEAYRAPDDRACHAYGNRRTPRTETMFHEGGHAYIYLCYGIHHLFNVVTGPKETAHAVLIRAIEPVEGVDTMLLRRNMQQVKPALTTGPGAMSQALGLSTALDKQYLLAPDSPIRLQNRNALLTDSDIIAAPRIGVNYAGDCAAWKWRFYLKASNYHK